MENEDKTYREKVWQFLDNMKHGDAYLTKILQFPKTAMLPAPVDQARNTNTAALPNRNTNPDIISIVSIWPIPKS